MKGVYIGHAQKLKKAMRDHKSNCHHLNGRDYGDPLYKVIRANGGWDNWHHVVLEIFLSIDKKEVLMRKREWIQKTPNVINVNRPITSKEEDEMYYEDNKDEVLASQKVYYEKNKDTINQKRI